MFTNQLLSHGFTREQIIELSIHFSFEKGQALQYLLEPITDKNQQPVLDSTGTPVNSLSVLIRDGFTPEQLLKILKCENEINNIDILLELIMPALDQNQQRLFDYAGNPITPLSELLSVRVSRDQIVSVLSHYRGSESLRALQQLLQPIQDANGSFTTPFFILTQMGFTPAGIIAVLNHDQGYRNLKALLKLFNPLPSVTGSTTLFDCLTGVGFTLNQIISVLSHDGGYKKLRALQRLASPPLETDEQPSFPAIPSPFTNSLSRLIQAGFTLSQLIFVFNRNSELVNLMNISAIFDFVNRRSRIVALFEVAKAPDRTIHTELLKTILKIPEYREHLAQQPDTAFQNLCITIKSLRIEQLSEVKIFSVADLDQLCQPLSSHQYGGGASNSRYRLFPAVNLTPTASSELLMTASMPF
ncbi:hypothetical protein [Legionella maceachernii]|uniref:Avirulence protein AvrBs3 n=1 Tax=Legionella maceachernii TaxID=466 RepID=A0A0W0WC31_9GAMM|nr:hypothetical protein [Legionella maceachernii]KTD29795.1 Avirulence protein AvrBs3 [Legionella maceachernii]SJZ79406.1 hypothetical protein SAMN02745128_01093 [Legionella maceachernii]SUP02907.1 Avirulence protein AvrBs3 [Legionella maceachernii]